MNKYFFKIFSCIQKAFCFKSFLIFAICFLTSFQIVNAKEGDFQKIPIFSSHIVDTTSWLSGQEVQAITKKLDTIQSQGKVQIAVLVIDSVQPETIEEYSIRVAESWKVGKKDVDNGILIIIAKADKKVRIEVGYGMEGIVTDVCAKHIISDMLPHFKDNVPHKAIDTAIHGIMQKVDKDNIEFQKQDSVYIDLISIIPIPALILLGLLGLIAAICFFSDEENVIIAGVAVPCIGGILAFIFYSFFISFLVALGAIILGIIIRFGLQIIGDCDSRSNSPSNSFRGGGGGSFGGGGSSGSWK